MPQVTVFVNTWKCTNCLGWRDSDPYDAALMARNHPGVPVGHCHFCWLGLAERPIRASLMVRETDPQYLLTQTVMGEEDIEPELERVQQGIRERGQRLPMDVVEQAAYRAMRRNDIAQAIVEIRKREYKP